MKQIDIVEAYINLEILKDKDFSPKDHWAIYQLRKTLLPRIEFQKEQDEKLRDKYRDKADEKGVLSGKAYQEYLKDKTEIDDMEVDGIEKINLPVVDGVDFILMEKLDSIINFQI